MRVVRVEDACLPSGRSTPYDGVKHLVRLRKAFFQWVPALLRSTERELPGGRGSARVQTRTSYGWETCCPRPRTQCYRGEEGLRPREGALLTLGSLAPAALTVDFVAP